MIQGILTSLGISLLLTLILEIVFFLVVQAMVKRYNTKDLILVAMVNILTNPVVVLLNWLAVLYTNFDRVTIIVPLELGAILIEGFIYAKCGKRFKQPYIFSLGANVFSFGVGLLIQMIIQGGFL